MAINFGTKFITKLTLYAKEYHPLFRTAHITLPILSSF